MLSRGYIRGAGRLPGPSDLDASTRCAFPGGPGGRDVIRGQLNESGVGNPRQTFLRQVVVDECGQFGAAGQVVGLHVDEQRPRQWVLETGDGLWRRCNATRLTAVDLDRLEHILVLLEEGEPDPSQRGGVLANALDDHVV